MQVISLIVLILMLVIYAIQRPFEVRILARNALAAFAAFLSVFAFVVLTRYAQATRAYSTNRVFRYCFEWLVIPTYVVVWPLFVVSLPRAVSTNVAFLWSPWTIGALVLLVVITGFSLERVRWPEPEQELSERYWSLATPPRKRADFIPTDFILALSFIVPAVISAIRT